MVVRGVARRRLVGGASRVAVVSLLTVANAWAANLHLVSAQPAAVPRAVTRTLHGYLQVHFIRGMDATGPISVTCKRATAVRYGCSWMTGPTGPGGYRLDYGGRANVVRRGRKLVVKHVVITCSPDGLHDVCPGPPLTLRR